MFATLFCSSLRTEFFKATMGKPTFIIKAFYINLTDIFLFVVLSCTMGAVQMEQYKLVISALRTVGNAEANIHMSCYKSTNFAGSMCAVFACRN